jgi:hypothetical protein
MGRPHLVSRADWPTCRFGYCLCADILGIQGLLARWSCFTTFQLCFQEHIYALVAAQSACRSWLWV